MKKLILLAMSVGLNARAAAFVPDYNAATRGFRETLTALVKADTTNPPGNEARAVVILAKRLKAEKIPYEIVEFAPGRENLVARLAGSGKQRPLLLLAHIDVVGTKDQNWNFPPHDVTEKDGFLYGRGVFDDLAMAVANLETFIILKRSGVKLRRDVILAYTGDEESGGEGIQYLLKHRPELIDAEIALNEGGGIEQDESGRPNAIRLQGAEKIYSDYTLITKGETGHSSVPKKNNAIYKMARALEKLGRYQPEERMIPLTRAYFKELAAVEKPETAKALRELAAAHGKLPEHALKIVRAHLLLAVGLSTTCVATMISGGTKVNALPPEVRANVNCRLLPDETPELVQARLAKIIGDPEVEISAIKVFSFAKASPVDGEIPGAVRELAKEYFPGLPVIPFMANGATDSRFLRAKGVAAYGFVPLALREADFTRAHGIDERIPIDSIKPGLEFMQRLVLKLAAE